MEGKPSPATGPKFSDCHTLFQKLCCLGDILNGFFFQNGAGLTFHFLRLYYPLKRKRREKREIHLCRKGHGLHSHHVMDLFFSTAVFTCIIFGEVLFPGSPKSVTRWRMIWTCRVFVAGKISPLRGSEGVRDTKLMLDLTDVRQESKRKVTWTLDFSAHFYIISTLMLKIVHIHIQDDCLILSRIYCILFLCALSYTETTLTVGFKL